MKQNSKTWQSSNFDFQLLGRTPVLVLAMNYEIVMINFVKGLMKNPKLVPFFQFVPSSTLPFSAHLHTQRWLAKTRAALQDYKEFIDAENLMPLGTSDLRSGVCLELKRLQQGRAAAAAAAALQATPARATAPYNFQQQHSAEMAGSVDSSDTYASCGTHPFASQADISLGALGSPRLPHRGPVKSASGDVLRAISPEDDDDDELEMNTLSNDFRPSNRGSRVSLNNSALPKHRKTRFQQVCQQHNAFPHTYVCLII
jgi:hypothetical protein